MNKLYEDLLEAFPDTTGRGRYGVDTRAAAKALGRSATSVRRWLAGTQEPPEQAHAKADRAAKRSRTTTFADKARSTRDQAKAAETATRDRFLHALTGNRGLTSNENSAPAELLRALFPSTKNPSGVDTRAAAAHYDRSPASIRRWINGVNAPTPDARQRLQREARQLATTQRGRAAALRKHAGILNRTDRNRARIAVDGIQGPKTQDPSARQGAYLRKRTTTVELSWEQYDQFVDAYIRGGQEAAQETLLGHLRSKGYPDDFGFAEIHGLGLGTTDTSRPSHWF